MSEEANIKCKNCNAVNRVKNINSYSKISCGRCKTTLIDNKHKRFLYIVPIVLIAAFFSVVMYENIKKATKQVRVERKNLTNVFYQNSVNESPEITTIAQKIKHNCVKENDDVCIVKDTLDFVTKIPYKISNAPARNPLKTIELNHGDCDDKSNLISSILKALNYKNYIVLTPSHAFVIVKIKNDLYGELEKIKGFYIKNEKYYILETTADGSNIGFDFNFALDEIKAIVDPFENKKMDTSAMEYKI